jgi:hypothetical protein
MRCVLGVYRYWAKRLGQPPPLEYTFAVETLPDGGLAAVPGSLRPFTQAELDEIFPNDKPKA